MYTCTTCAYPRVLAPKELLASLDASVMQNLGLGADHLDALRSRMHLACNMFEHCYCWYCKQSNKTLGRKKMRVDGDGSDDRSTEAPPSNVALSAPSAPSALPSTPSAVGTSSPSRSMTTEEICRLPTLPLGETDEAAPTLHDTQSMVRQDSVLVHGASFFDETPDGKICEAHHAMGEGEGQGIL